MKTNSIYSLAFLVSATILVSSCEFYCTDGNGNIKSEQRLIAAFYSVENTTSFDVAVIADSIYSVEVTADENILPLINTSVRGDYLVIDTENNQCIRNARSVRIDIHMPVLENIELSGSGNIVAYDFICTSLEIRNSGSGNIDMTNIGATDKVDIRLSGSGEISISGDAREGNYHLSGSGDILASDMLVDDCYVVNSGSGDIECFAYFLLDATLNGSGDILYYGAPEEVFEDDNGSGDIRQIN
jgi:hypothetical protein